MAERTISIKQINANLISKSMVVDGLVKAGMDWLNYQSSWEEITHSLSFISQLTIDKSIVETLAPLLRSIVSNSDIKLEGGTFDTTLDTFVCEGDFLSYVESIIPDPLFDFNAVALIDPVNTSTFFVNELLNILTLQLDTIATEIGVGQELQLEWSGTTDPLEVPIAAGDLVFSSSNQTVISVDIDGKIYGNQAGFATITIHSLANPGVSIVQIFTVV